MPRVALLNWPVTEAHSVQPYFCCSNSGSRAEAGQAGVTRYKFSSENVDFRSSGSS
jgi:hypothetical protein